MDRLTDDKQIVRTEQDLKSLEKWLQGREYDHTEVIRSPVEDIRTVVLRLKDKRVGAVVVPGQYLTGEVAFGKLTELLFINRRRAE